MKQIDYHIHTNVTDGKEDIKDIIEKAKKLGIKEIAITEHISKKPTYDWTKFKREIKKIKIKGIKIFVGVEAKILNKKGDLNVNDSILKKAEIVLGSVHGKGKIEWLLKSKCDIIAHPKINLKNINNFINCKKVLEINYKYRLPKKILDQLIIGTKNKFSFGSDAHSLNDLKKGQEYFKKIITRYPSIKIINLK